MDALILSTVMLECMSLCIVLYWSLYNNLRWFNNLSCCQELKRFAIMCSDQLILSVVKGLLLFGFHILMWNAYGACWRSRYDWATEVSSVKSWKSYCMGLCQTIYIMYVNPLDFCLHLKFSDIQSIFLPFLLLTGKKITAESGLRWCSILCKLVVHCFLVMECKTFGLPNNIALFQLLGFPTNSGWCRKPSFNRPVL